MNGSVNPCCKWNKTSPKPAWVASSSDWVNSKSTHSTVDSSNPKLHLVAGVADDGPEHHSPSHLRSPPMRKKREP